MDLYHYLSKVARSLDSLTQASEVHELLDELDRIQDMLDPEFQSVVDQLIQQLNEKLSELK